MSQSVFQILLYHQLGIVGIVVVLVWYKVHVPHVMGLVATHMDVLDTVLEPVVELEETRISHALAAAVDGYDEETS